MALDLAALTMLAGCQQPAPSRGLPPDAAPTVASSATPASPARSTSTEQQVEGLRWQVQNQHNTDPAALIGGLEHLLELAQRYPNALMYEGLQVSDLSRHDDLKITLERARHVRRRGRTKYCYESEGCPIVVASVRVQNGAEGPVRIRFRMDWREGSVPRSPVAACSYWEKLRCSTLYIVEADRSPLDTTELREITLAAGSDTTFDVQLDHKGKPSIFGPPLVASDQAGTYWAAAAIAYSWEGGTRVAYSAPTKLAVLAP